MARHIRLFGLASLVTTDDPAEIEVYLNHPALDRGYVIEGPVINRMIAATVRAQYAINGRYWISLRSRHDAERRASQPRQKELLDAAAARGAWKPEAIAALAEYVSGRGDEENAHAALAYGMAMPYRAAAPGGDDGFNPAQYRQIYKLYDRIRRSRSALSLRGAFIRATGGHTRARKSLLAFVGGDENGLHAIAIALDNAVPMLDAMREAFRGDSASKLANIPQPDLPWASVRTAPVLVLRQAREDVTLPFIERRLPAYTLVMMRMRDSIAFSPPGGYEFALNAWSYCPAARYLHAFFSAVWAHAYASRTTLPGSTMREAA
jgi:hypothetical protein